jgi:undecaprenyl-diphosphatase
VGKATARRDSVPAADYHPRRHELAGGGIGVRAIGALAFFGGTDGRDIATHMALAGLVNLTLYTFLKRWTGRPRPFVQCPDIRACARALDRFSFPSGHVLHALTFTIILTYHFRGGDWINRSL